MALVQQRRSWKRLTDETPPFEPLRNERVTCPCFSVFHGDLFEELTPEGVERWRVLANTARNRSYALALQSGANELRWLGPHYGPLRWVGSARDREYFYGTRPLQDDGGVLFEVSVASGQVRTLSIRGALIEKLRATTAGVVLQIWNDLAPRPPRELTLPWATLDSEIRQIVPLRSGAD